MTITAQPRQKPHPMFAHITPHPFPGPGAFSFLIDLLNDLNIVLDWSIGERCGGIQFAGAFDRSRGGTNGEIGLFSDLAKTLTLPGKPMPGLIGDRQDLAIDCTGGGFEGKGDNGDIRGTWGRGRAGGHMHIVGPAAPRQIQDHHVGRADTGIRGPRWLTNRAPRTQPTTCKSGAAPRQYGRNEG